MTRNLTETKCFSGSESWVGRCSRRFAACNRGVEIGPEVGALRDPVTSPRQVGAALP